MAEEEKISQPPPDVAKLLAGLTFTRSPEYKVVYSNVFRTRVGGGDITLIFSRITHVPSIAVAGDVVEEQIEVVMSWQQLKQFEMALKSVVDAIEQEVGEIQVPTVFKIDQDGQRAVVRSLGFPSPAK